MIQKQIDGQMDFFDIIDKNKDVVHKKKSITNFRKIKSMSMNELAAWLDKNCNLYDNSWFCWISKKYCDNCTLVRECVTCKLEVERCPYGLSTMPNIDLIKLWLKEKCDEI